MYYRLNLTMNMTTHLTSLKMYNTLSFTECMYKALDLTIINLMYYLLNFFFQMYYAPNFIEYVLIT